MSTQLEDVELELRRTRLLREQLALEAEMNARGRKIRAADARYAIGAAGAAAAGRVARPVARTLLFAVYWAINTAISYLLLCGGDPAHVGGSVDARMEHYFFWAIAAGLALALVEYPWKKGGAIISRKLFGK